MRDVEDVDPMAPESKWSPDLIVDETLIFRYIDRFEVGTERAEFEHLTQQVMPTGILNFRLPFLVTPVVASSDVGKEV